jgi:16S rRNA (cytidine1402-2'-O)-methyltransferase
VNAALYLVGTPIGNLGDLSQRALEVLRDVDLILAEDTRHTRKLLTHYDLHTRTQSCHKFNEASRVASVLRLVRDEERAVALVSNAGMPCISDPGSRLVAAFHEAGLPVEAVPGPTAVTTALALSGFEGRGFYFEGFLSPKSQARRNRLKALSVLPCPLVLYESTHRIAKLLADIETVLEARPVFLARELTKHYEQHLRGSAREVAEALAAGSSKGEFVVVIAPCSRRDRGKIDSPQGRC